MRYIFHLKLLRICFSWHNFLPKTNKNMKPKAANFVDIIFLVEVIFHEIKLLTSKLFIWKWPIIHNYWQKVDLILRLRLLNCIKWDNSEIYPHFRKSLWKGVKQSLIRYSFCVHIQLVFKYVTTYYYQRTYIITNYLMAFIQRGANWCWCRNNSFSWFHW